MLMAASASKLGSTPEATITTSGSWFVFTFEAQSIILYPFSIISFASLIE